MRSIATPTDQNDMMNRTTATPIAVGPIEENMSIRLRPPPPPPPPASCANAGLPRSTRASAAPETCPNCRIFRASITCPPKNGREPGSEPETGGQRVFLTQRELHRDCHDDGHGHTVEQCRGELPLFDRVERGLVE